MGKATPFWQLSSSHRCHQMQRTAEPSHSKSRQWKSMLIHKGWFTALYTLHLHDSQCFEYEICILQTLNMPLIRCTNAFFQEATLMKNSRVWLSAKHLKQKNILYFDTKTKPLKLTYQSPALLRSVQDLNQFSIR